MCKYCEGLKINPDTLGGEQDPLYEDPEVIIQIAQDSPIGRRHGSSSLDILVGSKVRYIQIFYCPMCGRKLNHIQAEESIKEEAIWRTSDDWKQEFGGMLQTIKHFKDRLDKLSEKDIAEIKSNMGYVIEPGTLKFIKDVYDKNLLSDLEVELKEKEGKI